MKNSSRFQRWVNRGRRTVGTAGWLVVVIAAFVLLIPSLLGFDRYVIVSGSMEPTFARGSIVFSKEKAVSDLRVGDVITYQPPASTGVDHLVTHRISRINDAPETGVTFRTKGDANPVEDPWTFQLPAPTQNVMKFTVPYLGHALIALANPKTRLVVIGIPAALIGLMALYDLVVESLLPRRVRAA